MLWELSLPLWFMGSYGTLLNKFKGAKLMCEDKYNYIIRVKVFGYVVGIATGVITILIIWVSTRG